MKARVSIAAPLIFIFMIGVQLFSNFLEDLKKRKLWNAGQMKLRAEIKELLKEAGLLSNPSTFAQAAKLRRLAAAKEKELLKSQEEHSKENDLSRDSYFKALKVLKVVVPLVSILWFWSGPIATVSQQLVQPFGRVLSWKGGNSADGYVRVGVIPWLIISHRVSKFVCQKLSK